MTTDVSRFDLALVPGDDCRRNATPDVETGFNCHLLGLDNRDEIIEDLVGNGFVEVTFIPVGPEVELEGLQLDNRRARPVADRNCGEVRLPRTGTEAGEFRTDHGCLVVPLWIRVRNRFELAAWFSTHDKRLPNLAPHGRCGQ